MFVAKSQLVIEETTLSDDVWETKERIKLGSGRLYLFRNGNCDIVDDNHETVAVISGE